MPDDQLGRDPSARLPGSSGQTLVLHCQPSSRVSYAPAGWHIPHKAPSTPLAEGVCRGGHTISSASLPLSLMGAEDPPPLPPSLLMACEWELRSGCREHAILSTPGHMRAPVHFCRTNSHVFRP